jgi:hypothetical protein
MKLNAAEKALMNNLVRAAIQRHYEMRILRWLAGWWAGIGGGLRPRGRGRDHP